MSRSRCLAWPVRAVLTVLVMGQFCWTQSNIIQLDNTVGLGRVFDGIGGLSGGSGTSKLLADYKDPQRSQILDFLFKPQYGASLQVLKVEIGGDAQSAAATEASHMHNSSDENYHRGYEWWLMAEAKKRNPDIKLYGLPWVFPGWIGNGTLNPYNDPTRLATYISKWVQGARAVHGLHIDYIGIWNERPYNVIYVKTLRKMLDDKGLGSTRIVAADNGPADSWDIVKDVMADAELDSAIDVIGVHYPGTQSSADAVELGKPLWSSEDYSTPNDASGAGCWARIINQNYVNGHMTSTIAWNLVDSWYQDLPNAGWEGDSLMTANQPWSGHYTVNTPIWASAHTTQFTAPGWLYLRHGHGVGRLDMGGSIVSLVSPDASQLTVVIETMSHDHSKCIRPELPAYNVTTQNVTLQLMGSFVDVQTLEVWHTKLGFDGNASRAFTKLPNIRVEAGQVKLVLGLDEIFTLTTVTSGQKGDAGTIPAPGPFPIEFFDFFESPGSIGNTSEPSFFAAQQGVFEVIETEPYLTYMRQTVLQTPIPWCPNSPNYNGTLALVGMATWDDIQIRTEVLMVPMALNGSGGVFAAARIDKAGCSTFQARGLYFWLYPNDQIFLLTTDIAGNEVIKGGRSPQSIDKVDNTMELLVYRGYVSGKVNKTPLFNVTIPPGVPTHGFVGVGTDSFGYADWEFFGLRNASNPIGDDDADHVLRFGSERH